MPVFNIAQYQQPDLSSLAPKTYSDVFNETLDLDPFATEPSELMFNENYATGDVVNTGSTEDRGPFYILPISADAPAPPSKNDVVSKGIPVYSGGSSYHIPEGCQLRFFVAANVIYADLKGQYFR